MFNFDKEVEPILTVLYTKLIEQSRMEVLEEEELRVIRQQQRHFENLKAKADEETRELERAEQERQEKNVNCLLSIGIKEDSTKSS